MASRFGVRPTGTDGSDFKHRQRVAIHYQQSVTIKFRLKLLLVLHLLLYFFMLFKLLEDILDKFQIDWGPLERLKVPDPELWEYAWTASIVPIVAAFVAMPRNREALMTKAYYGFFLFSVLPVAVGAGTNLPALLEYIKNPKNGKIELFLGFPEIVIAFMFMAIAIQIHGVTMYYAAQLVKFWRPQPISKSKSAPDGVPATPTSGSVTSSSSDVAAKFDKKRL